jgi:hypothetical protein
MQNRFLIFIAVVLLSSCSVLSEMGYKDYSETEGLKISTKWGQAKNEAGEQKLALILALENTNEYPIGYSFDILLYYEGVLRETGRINNECLKKLQSKVGKLNGIYFIPKKFTAQQLESDDFNLAIEEIEVREISDCDQD